MDEITYRDPKVIELIKARYLAVRVDQDSRPDLSNRYEYYGWPATIVFNTDGSEIVKRRGYIPPKPMASSVVGARDDPAAEALFRAALAHPATYKRVEWWDRREGPLPNADVPYPKLEKAAAFVCTDRACSAPMFTPEAFASFFRPANSR